MNLYSHQDANMRKTWVFMTLFLLFVIAVGWVFAQYYQSSVILYVAVGLAIFLNIFSYWFSDKIVLKMSRARPVTREEHMDLWNITENLAITAGLPMPRLYIIEDPAPNAFATGRNKDHAVVAVTTGLLQVLDRSELEGVIAHELAHIGNRDMLLSTIVVVMAGFITILSDIFLRSMHFGGGDRNNKAGGILLIAGLVLAILAPIVALVIRLAISRKREFLADASGALLTRYPDGLANALRKIAASGRPLRHANHATAHLFIENPFGGDKKSDKPSFLTKMFMTHPPVEERIDALVGRKFEV